MRNKMTPKKLIDIIAPKHDRTSCDDKHLNNGFYSNTKFTRCARCTLLQILKDGQLPKSHNFEINCYIDEKI